MSIKLRAIDKLAYICTFDSAVCAEKSDLEKYRETLDRKYLTLEDGGQPSVFHLRRLTGPQMQHVRSKQRLTAGGVEGTHEAAAEAVAYGLAAVENFDGCQVRHKKSDLGERLTPESLAPILLSADLLYELGNAIQKLGGLDPLA